MKGRAEAAPSCLGDGRGSEAAHAAMPPPPPGIAGAGSSGSSATMASVVISRPAIEPHPAAPRARPGRVDDTGLDRSTVLLLLRVEAERLRLVLEDLADHDRALDTRVLRDLPQRCFERLEHDVDAGLMSELSLVSRPIAFLARSSATPPPGTMPSSTAARVALRASSTRSFFFFHLDLGGAADTITATPPASGQPLLQLLTVVVRGGFFDLRLDLADPGFDVLLLAGAIDDGGLFLLDDDLLGPPEHVERDVLELDAEISEISWPPVRMAMSSSMALRRSPKPGAFTAATFRPPRSC